MPQTALDSEVVACVLQTLYQTQPAALLSSGRQTAETGTYRGWSSCIAVMHWVKFKLSSLQTKAGDSVLELDMR